MSMGRPSKYDPDVHNDQALKLTMLGLTDKELADFFDINEDTLNEWKKDATFSESLKKGKELADAEVTRSLFERATGYEAPDTDIRVVNGQIVKTDLIKHYPPDTLAIIYWLNNRQRKKWKQAQEKVDEDAGKPIVWNEEKTYSKPDKSKTK